MPAYRAVLFDFFGTLSCCVRRGSTHGQVADLLGCTPQDLAAVLDRTYYQRASGRRGSAEESLRWVCEQVGVRPSDANLRTAVAARFAGVRSDTRLRPDAVSALRGLRERGIRTGLVSDCTHELPHLLPQLPIASLLETVVFSVDLGHCKPDPALYLTACGRLGVPPQECLYVGDGDSQELTGAERVGLTAVRLAAPDLADHLVFNTDPTWDGPVLDSLSAVIDLVDPALAPA